MNKCGRNLKSSALKLSHDVVDYAIAERCRLAREDFATFRRTINPKIKWGWFHQSVCDELQRFHADFVAGKRPRLVIQAPPQHGKSMAIIDFIAWLAGKSPDKKTIYASFSERLGIRANLRMQRILDGEQYGLIFPATKLNASNVVTISGQYLRNREILEYVGHEGYFRNTTVEGSITGESLDLGVIDDPVKSRAEANSQRKRDGVWDWFCDDFSTRFSDDGALLCILTRWHIDDPIGRLIATDSSVRVVSFPAIATRNETHRREGEALFPELKSIEFLLAQKKKMANHSWESLYQQSPTVQGGELIRGEWFGSYSIETIQPSEIILFADTAQKTGERNDYSVVQAWGKHDGRIYLLDQIRGKWEAPELLRRVRDFWVKWSERGAKKIMIEDKSSGTGLIQQLKTQHRVPVFGIQRATDKLTRVQDALPHIECGNVMLPANAPWVSDFIAECEAFTADNSHAHDDQIDPMCDAIKTLLQSNSAAEKWARMI